MNFLLLSIFLFTCTLSLQTTHCFVVRSTHAHAHAHTNTRTNGDYQNHDIITKNKLLGTVITTTTGITTLSLSSQKQQQPPPPNNNNNNHKIRLNKVFKATHSRREADKLIQSGRVSVNHKSVLNSNGGFFVIPHVDIVSLDGIVVKGWEDMNAVDVKVDVDVAQRNFRNSNSNGNSNSNQNNTKQRTMTKMTKSHFEYIKYYKPTGVTCTTDSKVRGNIIESIQRHGYRSPHRIYPVGRLDKDTSGLIILTSDGRLPNAVLRGMNKQPKVYEVEVDYPLNEQDMHRLRNGIMITTVSQRDAKSKRLTARTKPCTVERLGVKKVQMTLMEGRNRQIRKMMGALGLTVLKLHRVRFMNIDIDSGTVIQSRNDRDDHRNSNGNGNGNGIRNGNRDCDQNVRQTTSNTCGLKRPGDWSFLDKDEMMLVEDALQSAFTNQTLMNNSSNDVQQSW